MIFMRRASKTQLPSKAPSFRLALICTHVAMSQSSWKVNEALVHLEGLLVLWLQQLCSFSKTTLVQTVRYSMVLTVIDRLAYELNLVLLYYCSSLVLHQKVLRK